MKKEVFNANVMTLFIRFFSPLDLIGMDGLKKMCIYKRIEDIQHHNDHNNNI